MIYKQLESTDLFWKRFYELCAQKNKRPSPVGRELGISPSMLTKWKAGAIPNGESLIKLADYFNCSVDYLLGRTDCPSVASGDGEGDKS